MFHISPVYQAIDVVIERKESERANQTLATPAELRVPGPEAAEDNAKHFSVVEVSPRKWTIEGPIPLRRIFRGTDKKLTYIVRPESGEDIRLEYTRPYSGKELSAKFIEWNLEVSWNLTKLLTEAPIEKGMYDANDQMACA